MILQKLLPQTLFMRLVMVWLSSIFILKGITLLTINDWSEQILFRHMVKTEAQLLSLYIHVVTGFIPTGDISIAQTIELEPNLKAIFTYTQPEMEESSSELSQFLHQQMIPYLEKGNTVYTKLITNIQFFAENTRVDESNFLGMRLPTLHKKRLIRTDIAIKLNNKIWLHLKHTLGLLPNTFLYLQIIRLVGELIFMLLATLAVVSWIIRPLENLANTADTIAQDQVFTPFSTKNGPKEVKKVAEAFNRMQQNLKEYTEGRTNMIAAVSHDLRTPLTRLRLRLEQVESISLREKLVHDVDALRRTLDTTITLIRSINSSPPKEQVNIMDLVQDLIIERQEIGQPIVLAGQVNCTLHISPIALTSCLENLMDNALRYGEQREVVVKIYEEISKEDRLLCIDVLDSGPGIPEKSLETVFNAYHRLELSRNIHTGGYGLGLAIARNLARKSSGDIILSNRPQGGLKASLQLKIPKSS